jgi:hypothetical protein
MHDELFAKLSRFGQSAVSRLRVRSALNPLLWLSTVVGVMCFGAACWLRFDRAAMFAMIAIGAIPVLVTCGVACYFAALKPEKLQSEDYQLRQQAMMIIKEKGGRMKLDAISLENIVVLGTEPDAQSDSEGTGRRESGQP